MACFEISEADDKEITGVCSVCGEDVNKDGETVENTCSYSGLQCDKCGYQPCDQSC